MTGNAPDDLTKEYLQRLVEILREEYDAEELREVANLILIKAASELPR